MKWLLTVVIVLAGLYAGFWLVASRGLDRALQTTIAGAEAQGWDITTASLNTGGFPSRFDVKGTGLRVAAPDGNLVWEAPWLQTVALSYRPTQAIVVFPPQQSLTVNAQEFQLESTGMRASASVAPNTRLSFDAFTLEAADLTIDAGSGWSLSTGAALMALRQQGPAANQYETYLGLSDIMPQSRIADAPPGAAQLTADASVILDRPLDRLAVSGIAPRLTQITLNDLDFEWGTLQLTGDGTLDVDSTGMPSGRIMLTATGWQDHIAMLSASGLIPPDTLPMVTGVARMLSGGTDKLTLPLTFANDSVALGPLPLGPAPRLALR